MKSVIIHRDRGPSPIVRAKVASSPWSRFWGLMGKRALPEGEALLIEPCYSVHTMFMRFPIDVVFLDGEQGVMKVADALKPFRASVCRGARRVLEMRSGDAARAGIVVGDRLRIEATG